MNSTNPFQIPSCFQIDAERRRREKFKKTVIAVIVGSTLLLVGLLIEGCVSERSGRGNAVSPAAERPLFMAELQGKNCRFPSGGLSISLSAVSNLSAQTGSEL
ncbi:MAG: hypothetical protein ACLQSR_07365 [Limisphaerales bacterium]